MYRILDILVVEDSQEDSLLLHEFFAAEKFSNKVKYARNIAEARKLISEHEFNLFLIDKHLPDGDGIEFAKELREAGEDSNIICLSGASDFKTVHRAKEVGITGFVEKPLTFEVLRKMLKQVENMYLGLVGKFPIKTTKATALGLAVALALSGAANSKDFNLYDIHLKQLTEIVVT